MSEGKVRRALRRFAADDEEIANEDLQERAEQAGATAVSQCGVRERVTILGTVQSTVLRPRAGVPALEAELYDGTGTVSLVFLGRRQIAGIRTGVTISAEGRVGLSQGRRVIINPAYTLLPGRD